MVGEEVDCRRRVDLSSLEDTVAWTGFPILQVWDSLRHLLSLSTHLRQDIDLFSQGNLATVVRQHQLCCSPKVDAETEVEEGQ